MWYVHLTAGEEQIVLLRVLGIRLGCLLGKSVLFPSSSQESCMERCGQVYLIKQGPWILREEEIVSGCAVLVACPSCPDHSPEPPGPGRIIRNMLGLGYGCSAVLSKGRLSLPLSQLETGSGKGRTTQRGRSLVVPRVLVRTRTGKAPLLGHVLDSDVGHCLPVCGGLSLP